MPHRWTPALRCSVCRPEALYLWGTLRDDEGDLHTIMRRIPTVRCSTDVDGEVTFDEANYWQTGARFRMGDSEYEFLPDPRGRMPDLGPIPNPQVDGRWRRVGDTREPDVWFAWGEAVPSNGRTPKRRRY